MKYKYTILELKEIINTSLSVSEVCKKLNIKAAGGNYKTINSKIKEFNIDISHFTGKGWNTGNKYQKVRKPKSLEDILVKNKNTNTFRLKNRLIKSNIKQHICEICNLSEWLKKPIPLELHHINGDNIDNRIENIQLLCPNCHAQTDNYRGKNIKSS